MTGVTRVLLLDGDIPKYTTAYACVDETEKWKVDWTAKSQMESICDLSGCSHYLSFLTDSASNFRNTRATTWPYKGTRESKETPMWIPEISEYYEDTYGFQMMRGVEADDALTIAAEYYKAKGIPVACATKDKDLKQYPWDLFVDLNSMTTYSITKEEAHRNLWRQMLIGDVAVDNIPGLSHAIKYETTVEGDNKKRGASDLLLGKVTADKYLDTWDPECYAANTLGLYLDYYEGNEGNTQAVRDTCEDQGISFGEYRYYETFDLIWMLREAPKDLVIHYDHQVVPVKTAGLHSIKNEFTDETEEF